MLKVICLILITNTCCVLSDSIQIENIKEPKGLESEFNGTDGHDFRYYRRNCAEATASTKTSGIYEIVIPSLSENPFRVYCDADTRGGGWTVILSRMDGSEYFYRNWETYKNGFGSLDGEFFLGLDKIHALTTDFNQELLVIIEDFFGDERYEIYDSFGIASEKEQYALNKLGKASGTAGDSLSYHYKMKFSTFDRKNDMSTNSCAVSRHGAWWYRNCLYSNLAGNYNDTNYQLGVVWQTFRGWGYTHKRALMMVRPRK